MAAVLIVADNAAKVVVSLVVCRGSNTLHSLPLLIGKCNAKFLISCGTPQCIPARAQRQVPVAAGLVLLNGPVSSGKSKRMRRWLALFDAVEAPSCVFRCRR